MAATSRSPWVPALWLVVAIGIAPALLVPQDGDCAPPDGWHPRDTERAESSGTTLRDIGPALEPDGRSPLGAPSKSINGAAVNSGELHPPEVGGGPTAAPPEWSTGPPPTPPPLLRFFQLPEERFRGVPSPLVRQSWGYRPFSLGAVFGFIEGSALIDDWVYQDNGVIAGFRIGWDHQHYWGLEMRFAWASLDTYNGWRAEQAAGYPNAEAIYPGGTNDMFFWDTNLMWYPTGDTRCRPYLAAGLGLATVDFADALGTQWSDTMFALPLSVGLKYRCTDHVALRLEATENLVFGSRPIGFFEDLSVTGGVEWRFGGARRAYWPWNPGRHYW